MDYFFSRLKPPPNRLPLSTVLLPKYKKCALFGSVIGV